MSITSRSHSTACPPRRKIRHSYNENVDEPGKLIENESTDIERETPAEENEPVQQGEDLREVEPPVFED